MNLRIILLSSSNCVKCRSIAPSLEEFCSNNLIHYQKLDALGEGRSLVDAYNLRSVPAVFIYDVDTGNLLNHFLGDFTLRDISEFVISLKEDLSQTKGDA